MLIYSENLVTLTEIVFPLSCWQTKQTRLQTQAT